jgi:hypothetical protein
MILAYNCRMIRQATIKDFKAIEKIYQSLLLVKRL